MAENYKLIKIQKFKTQKGRGKGKKKGGISPHIVEALLREFELGAREMVYPEA